MEGAMRDTLNGATPQNGDIVIVHYATSPIQWMVRQIPDPAQFGSSSREQAFQLARGYAQAHRLDLWCNEGGGVQLIEQHRPAPIAPPMPRENWVEA
jgi:hypothetical protein